MRYPVSSEFGFTSKVQRRNDHYIWWVIGRGDTSGFICRIKHEKIVLPVEQKAGD